MKTLIALTAIFALAASAALKLPQEFVEWKKTHNKVYGEELEEMKRLTIWQSNKVLVEGHNALAEEYGYTLAMNEFADLSGAEFAKIYNGYRMDMRPKSNDSHIYKPDWSVELPSSMDWRQKGAVTGIKNQGQCGSCWSFSATGSMEGQHFLKAGRLVSLSEQNLVDCSRSYGNNGCNGGIMDYAFRYVIANRGDDTESSYPYTARDGSCHFKSNEVGATISNYHDVPRGSETALMSASANVGPISVAIDASHNSFQLYHSGVYNERSCSSSRLDHGVLVVGYGTENGQDYWLVKNSWGTRWGMNGYIMMSRNRNNQCGIATQASYPIV